jgi:hypothetical protein
MLRAYRYAVNPQPPKGALAAPGSIELPSYGESHRDGEIHHNMLSDEPAGLQDL